MLMRVSHAQCVRVESSGVVLLVNLCPRPGYPTLFSPDLAREVIVLCDHMITVLHITASDRVPLLFVFIFIILLSNMVETQLLDRHLI